MSRHGAGVAQREVNEFVAVKVAHERAVSLRKAQWKASGPFIHPRHRDPRQEMVGVIVKGSGVGVQGLVEGTLFDAQLS